MNALAQRAFSSRSSAFVASPVAPARRVVLAAPCAKVSTVEVEAKLKTRKAAAKRYKVSGSGKVCARHSGKQHMNEKQSTSKKLALSKTFVVSPSDIYKASRCLPYASLM